ncbi:MAG TPA: DUF6159 family protein [Candidatus Thermoplasmatota archaeon]|nr:DUF6159 family protein [Candidatus Thermoplasmatota archaeon]
MFESISRGWQLTKASFRVLKLDKEILLLPIMAGALTVLIWAAFLVPLEITGAFESMNALSGLGLLFVLYVLTYFAILFFNAAVIECAMIRFNGGDPVVKDGLRKAWSKKVRIFQWAIIAGTVGLILKLLDALAREIDNPITEIIVRIMISLVGAAWNIATFFVMPILIYQDMGPGQAIKTSWTTWKRTWGESATASFTTGIIFFLLMIPAFIMIWLAAPAAFAGSVMGLVFLALGIVLVLGLSAMSSAVNGIVVAAIYKYSQDGRLPEIFESPTVPQTTAKAPF